MLIHVALVFLFSLLVLMAGLWFLHYTKKEMLTGIYRIAAYATISVSLLMMLGLVVGGIVKMTCHKGCHGKEKGCHKEMKHCSSKEDGHCSKSMASCPMLPEGHPDVCGSSSKCGKGHGMSSCGGMMKEEIIEISDSTGKGNMEKEIHVKVQAH